MGTTLLGLVKKVPIWLWILGAAIGYFTWSQNKIDSLSAEISRAGVGVDTVAVIDSATVARMARTEVERDSLKDALDMAETFNAELIAAARLGVDPRPSPPDTHYVPVEVLPDSTRIGSLIDSVYADDDSTLIGVSDISVAASPLGPLTIVNAFDVAPIDFTVSLLRFEDESVIFSVKYWGGTADISTPFARLPARPKTIVPYVGTQYNLTARMFEVKGGANLRLPVFGLSGFLEGTQPLADENVVITAGLIKEF